MIMTKRGVFEREGGSKGGKGRGNHGRRRGKLYIIFPLVVTEVLIDYNGIVTGSREGFTHTLTHTVTLSFSIFRHTLTRTVTLSFSRFTYTLTKTVTLSFSRLTHTHLQYTRCNSVI